MTWTDQYGDDVPGDLVLLPDIEKLTPGQAEVVDLATWYEVGGILCVSAAAIGFLSEDYIETDGTNIEQVCFCDHRYDYVNGFHRR